MATIEQVTGSAPVMYKVDVFAAKKADGSKDHRTIFVGEGELRALRAALEAFAQAPMISKVTVTT